MRLFLMFLLLGGLTTPALAAYQWTDREIKSMPPYCAARLNKESPQQYKHWENVLGPDFLHTHHYCEALGYINRYYVANTAPDKAGMLQGAIGHLRYMVNHASPTYSLMPEIYLNRGQVFSLMKKDAEAIADMRKAFELNPKLARAYSMLADQYTQLNQRDNALKVVTEGLRHIPDSKTLQRLYVKLGGQLPYPEPAAPQAATPVASPTESTAVETFPEPVPDAATKNNVPSDVQPAPKPKIGTPSNPWCRFCPEPGQ